MQIKNVAVFHNLAGVGSAWCCAEGLVTTLTQQGYRAFNCGHPRATTMPLELLSRMDLIILAAPEWYGGTLLERYGKSWHELSVTKVAWYAESFHRDDRTFQFSLCRTLADLHYFPAAQDADEFGGDWLPFGADTSVFYPMPDGEKCHEVAFLGSLYPKRIEYLNQLGFPVFVMPTIKAGDLAHSFRLLARSYNSTKIFLNLPAYSRLLVTKVTEVMACRTMLITPTIDHPSGLRNLEQFENFKHLVYYDQNKPRELSEILMYYRHHPTERDAVALAGWNEIKERHTLAHRTQKIVADARLVDHRHQGRMRDTCNP